MERNDEGVTGGKHVLSVGMESRGESGHKGKVGGDGRRGGGKKRGGVGKE